MWKLMSTLSGINNNVYKGLHAPQFITPFSSCIRIMRFVLVLCEYAVNASLNYTKRQTFIITPITARKFWIKLLLRSRWYGKQCSDLTACVHAGSSIVSTAGFSTNCIVDLTRRFFALHDEVSSNGVSSDCRCPRPSCSSWSRLSSSVDCTIKYGHVAENGGL